DRPRGTAHHDRGVPAAHAHAERRRDARLLRCLAVRHRARRRPRRRPPGIHRPRAGGRAPDHRRGPGGTGR
ncbi:MAG: hypothetical protein AVDCRST_MAG57-3768, partial [uncultured Blastococcus sp.]